MRMGRGDYDMGMPVRKPVDERPLLGLAYIILSMAGGSFCKSYNNGTQRPPRACM